MYQWQYWQSSGEDHSIAGIGGGDGPLGWGVPQTTGFMVFMIGGSRYGPPPCAAHSVLGGQGGPSDLLLLGGGSLAQAADALHHRGGRDPQPGEHCGGRGWNRHRLALENLRRGTAGIFCLER